MEAGCSKAEITPDIGVPLSGFIFRENQPSTGVDEPLYVRVLVLREHGKIFLLASYDLLGIGADVQAEIKIGLAEQFGPLFSDERCQMITTHNHSGPPVVHLEMETPPSPAYRRQLVRATSAAALSAVERLQKTELFTANLNVPGLTYNRRAVLRDGRVSMALEPDDEILERGETDSLATLLLWKSVEGKPIAGVMHYACHGVAVCTQTIGADIPGQISEQFEKLTGAPCLFLQGAAGEVNPTVVSSGREEMLDWVDRFFRVASPLLKLAKPVPVSEITAVRMTVPLEYALLPARAELEARIRGLEQVIGGDIESESVRPAVRSLADIMNFKPGEKPDRGKAVCCAAMLASAARRTLAAIEKGTALPPCPLDVAVWKLGTVVLTFISAELFTSTGQSIRGLRRDQTFLPVSYAAPLVGYLPDLRATQTGGYEVESAWQFYGQPAPFQPRSDRVVIQALEGMLAFLESKER